MAAIGVVHLAITSAAWRDINGRSPDHVRGSKRLWRAVSALNTGGTIAYFLLGRKRARPDG